MVPGMIAASALVVASREIAGAFWGTSYLLLATAMLSAAAIVRGSPASDSPIAHWRRRTGAIATILVAQPALWAVVALADHWAPHTRTTWAAAVLAGTWHLPLIATFSLLPLLVIAEISSTHTHGRIVVVAAALAGAATSFVLFFAEFEPFRAEPLVTWEPGRSIGGVLNLVFLGSVLLGPVSALVRSVRAAETAQPMARLALSSFVGIGVVMLCGALGNPVGPGVVSLFVGLDAAVAITTIGTLRVLASRWEVAPEAVLKVDRLSTRESEVLGLVADGLTNTGIAEKLFVSERTVDAHLRSIFAKLELPDGPRVNRRVHAACLWNELRNERTTTTD